MNVSNSSAPSRSLPVHDPVDVTFYMLFFVFYFLFLFYSLVIANLVIRYLFVCLCLFVFVCLFLPGFDYDRRRIIVLLHQIPHKLILQLLLSFSKQKKKEMNALNKDNMNKLCYTIINAFNWHQL